MESLKAKPLIHAMEFDGFVSVVAADIWNNLVKTPAFHALKPAEFAEVFEVVAKALERYRRPEQVNHDGILP